MISLFRTNSSHPDFVKLVQLLDAELAVFDGNEYEFYHQFNQIDKIKHAVVAYEGKQAVAIGAIRHYNDEEVEIKRMYTRGDARGRGYATEVLKELEKWAKELGYMRCILETGKRQEAAVALYQIRGYLLTPKYGPYIDMDNSLCFSKDLF